MNSRTKSVCQLSFNIIQKYMTNSIPYYGLDLIDPRSRQNFLLLSEQLSMTVDVNCRQSASNVAIKMTHLFTKRTIFQLYSLDSRRKNPFQNIKYHIMPHHHANCQPTPSPINAKKYTLKKLVKSGINLIQVLIGQDIFRLLDDGS